MRKKLLNMWMRWRTPLVLATLFVVFGPTLGWSADVQALANQALDGLSTTLAIGGATAVPLYITLENMVMNYIPNPPSGTWHTIRTLLPAVFSLGGWILGGVAHGASTGTILLGATTTYGFATLTHEILSYLPAPISVLASTGLALVKAVEAPPSPLTDSQKIAQQEKHGL